MKNYKKVLAGIIGILIIAAIPVLTFADPIIDANHYYEFEGNSDDTIGGGTYDGTEYNGPVFVTGQYGDAIDLEAGSSQYIRVPNSVGTGVLWTRNSWSINVWLKMETIGSGAGNQSIIMDASGSKGLNIYYNWSNCGGGSPVNCIVFSKPGVVDLNYTWAGADTNFHMWTFTSGNSGDPEGAGMRIYIDGVEVTNNSNSATLIDPDGYEIPIGGYLNGGTVQAGWYFDGLVDDISFADYQMTEEEVLALFEAEPDPGDALIEFSAPTDTGTFADFQFWEVDLTGTIEDGSVINIEYAPVGESDEHWVDSAIWHTGNPLEGFRISKSRRLWDPAYPLQDIDWGAEALLYSPGGGSSHFDGLIDTSGIIIFTINERQSYTVTASSTTDYAVAADAAALIGVDCTPYATSTWTDTIVDGLGCIMRKTAYSVGQFLFVPSKSTTEFFSNAYQDFKGTFPFSIFFQTIDTVDTIAGNYSSSTAATLALTVKFPYQTTSTIDILTPSTLADHGFTQVMLNWWYNLVLMGCILCLVYGLFNVIYHPQ